MLSHATAQDWVLILGALTAVIGAVTTAAVTVIKALAEMRREMAGYSATVDGHLSKLLELTLAQGITQGRALATQEALAVVATAKAAEVQKQ